MKKRLLSPILRNALVSCMIFSTWINGFHACILFFGEYPYPRKEEYTS